MLENKVNDLDEFQQKVWNNVIKVAKPEGLKYFQAEYAKFPTAKGLDGERYKNFMVYKLLQSYETTRKQFPDLPEL